MKLLHTLKILLEQQSSWKEKVFQSHEIEEILPIVKLFGGDIHELYNALDKIGKGRGIS